MKRFLLIMLVASTGLPTTGLSQTYATRFEGIESPLSEGGRWTNSGLDWTEIRKTNGLPAGSETGTNTGIYA